MLLPSEYEDPYSRYPASSYLTDELLVIIVWVFLYEILDIYEVGIVAL